MDEQSTTNALKQRPNSVEHTISAAETTRLALENPRPAMVRTRSASADVTGEHKETVLEGLRAGRSLASVLRDNPALPGATAIRKARNADDEFDREYQQAKADGLQANIDEALDYAHAVRGNKMLSVAASKYTDSILKAAPLASPKHFGPMLKLAGADGEKLTVALVSYLPEQSAPQLLEAQATTVEPVRQVARQVDGLDD